jgi:bacteriorhodopsin
MLWALGVFDSTVEPLLHAIVFGLFGVFLFGFIPLLIGWALQGFVIRRKASEEDDETPDSRPAARPVAAHAPAARGKAS